MAIVENKGVEGDVDADFKKVVLEVPVKAAEKWINYVLQMQLQKFCII